MRKYLLPETGSFYKANLHCHTNLSDGNGVCEASFKAEENTGYVRITVYDKSGKYAATNAYFCDTLFK